MNISDPALIKYTNLQCDKGKVITVIPTSNGTDYEVECVGRRIVLVSVPYFGSPFIANAPTVKVQLELDKTKYDQYLCPNNHKFEHYCSPATNQRLCAECNKMATKV